MEILRQIFTVKNQEASVARSKVAVPFKNSKIQKFKNSKMQNLFPVFVTDSSPFSEELRDGESSNKKQLLPLQGEVDHGEFSNWLDFHSVGFHCILNFKLKSSNFEDLKLDRSL